MHGSQCVYIHLVYQCMNTNLTTYVHAPPLLILYIMVLIFYIKPHSQASVFIMGLDFIFIQGCECIAQPCDKIVARLLIIHNLVQHTQPCDNLDFSLWI